MIKEFITKDGLTVPTVTKEQMIEVDRVAVEETGPNLFQKMSCCTNPAAAVSTCARKN